MDSTGTLEHLDPHTLQVDTNIRTTVTIDKGLVESIRHNGVLTPVLAWRDQDGAVHVRAGQRRTLAAREAGISTVPVYIVDALDGDAVRIVEQMVENEQRHPLTDTDRVQAWKQMELTVDQEKAFLRAALDTTQNEGLLPKSASPTIRPGTPRRG